MGPVKLTSSVLCVFFKNTFRLIFHLFTVVFLNEILGIAQSSNSEIGAVLIFHAIP